MQSHRRKKRQKSRNPLGYLPVALMVSSILTALPRSGNIPTPPRVLNTTSSMPDTHLHPLAYAPVSPRLANWKMANIISWPLSATVPFQAVRPWRD